MQKYYYKIYQIELVLFLGINWLGCIIFNRYPSFENAYSIIFTISCIILFISSIIGLIFLTKEKKSKRIKKQTSDQNKKN